MKKAIGYIILSVALIISLIGNVYLYVDCRDTHERVSNLIDHEATLHEQIGELKSTVATYKNNNNNNKANSNNNNNNNTYQKPSLTPNTEKPTYSNNITEDDDTSCIIPSCNNRAQNNSFYCFRHECLDVGCHEKKANDFCQYCVNHKCAEPNCNSGKAFNSAFCYLHKNR